MVHFGNNLKRLCIIKKTSPSKLCKSLGLSTSKVNAWYRGSVPKISIMQMMADELGCQIKDFFVDDETEMLLPNQETSEDIEEMLRIYNELSRREKHEFMSMVYSFETKTHKHDK